MQKNDTEENIPLLPWFEALLLQTPTDQRRGWVFKPLSLQLKLQRKVRHQRPDARLQLSSSSWRGQMPILKAEAEKR